MKKKSTRRKATEKKIMKAAEALLIEEGFTGLGINAIARQAGVSKELIYRYFGSVPELILELMKDYDYWARWDPSSDVHPASIEEESLQNILNAMLIEHLNYLHEQPHVKEIRRWELVSKNEITVQLGAAREKAGQQFLEDLDPKSDVDVPAVAAILQSGLIYLVLRSTTLETFFGVNLRTKKGWDRIEKAIKVITAKVFDEGDGSEPNRKPEKKPKQR